MDSPIARSRRGKSPAIMEKSLSTEIPGRTRTWRERKEMMDQLPSDSQSLSQATQRGDDGSANIATQLPDRAERARLDSWHMEDLFEIGNVVGKEDAQSLETLMSSQNTKRTKFITSWPLQGPAFYKFRLTKNNRGRARRMRRVRNSQEWR